MSERKFTMEEKEPYYILAVQNLQRQVNYLQLYHLLRSGQINKEEFDKELTEHQDSYVIKMRPLENFSELLLITEVFQSLNLKDVCLEDLAKMFSVTDDSIREELDI